MLSVFGYNGNTGVAVQQVKEMHGSTHVRGKQQSRLRLLDNTQGSRIHLVKIISVQILTRHHLPNGVPHNTAHVHTHVVYHP